ncbi:fimbrial protein [Citrobacter werkmanii]|nr:fimbrial protein [Citrobacter werkmanii]
MKKAILAAAMVMAMGSTSAMAVEGGQIEFHGLVSATTCSKVVSSSRGNQATDGDVYLTTAAPGDITKGVEANAFGALPAPFSIILDCSGSVDVNDTMKASLVMDSSFANTTGTLDNDTALNVSGEAGAENVNIAIHDADTNTQVKVDGAEVHEAAFTNKVATYNFMASYVRADASKEVTTGHVTTNAMYTFTYQ